MLNGGVGGTGTDKGTARYGGKKSAGYAHLVITTFSVGRRFLLLASVTTIINTYILVIF